MLLNPRRRYRLHEGDGSDPTIVNPARLPAAASSEICGACHGVHWIKDAAQYDDLTFVVMKVR